MNVQIFFYRANETTTRLPAEFKKRAFLYGLLAEISDAEAFKKFVMRYNLFDIIAINDTKYTKIDGSSGSATFVPRVNQSDLPDGEVYCGLLEANVLPKGSGVLVDETKIHYLLLVRPDEITDHSRQQVEMIDKTVLDSIKTLIDLYGNVAEIILDKIGDKELNSIEILEKYLKLHQL